MEVGAVSSILNGMQQGGDLTNGLIALSEAQAAMNTQLLVELFALKSATEIQEVAALALIQSAMGVGQNIDTLA
jgi:hypothetical protein